MIPISCTKPKCLVDMARLGTAVRQYWAAVGTHWACAFYKPRFMVLYQGSFQNKILDLADLFVST